MTYSSKSRQLTDLPNVINDLINLNPSIVSSAFTLTAEDHNKLFVCTNESSIVITVSDDLPDTFNALILCTKGPVMVTGLDSDGVLFENKRGGIHTAGSALTVKGLPLGTPWYAWVVGGGCGGDSSVDVYIPLEDLSGLLSIEEETTDFSPIEWMLNLRDGMSNILTNPEDTGGDSVFYAPIIINKSSTEYDTGGDTFQDVYFKASVLTSALAGKAWESVYVLTRNITTGVDTWQTFSYRVPLAAGDVEEAPVDGKQYARKDGAWEEVQSGSTIDTLDDVSDVDTEGKSDGDVLTWNATAAEWQAKEPQSEVEEAPNNGKFYGRKNGTWQVGLTPGSNPSTRYVVQGESLVSAREIALNQTANNCMLVSPITSDTTVHSQWVQMPAYLTTSLQPIPDGNYYGVRNGGWVSIPVGLRTAVNSSFFTNLHTLPGFGSSNNIPLLMSLGLINGPEIIVPEETDTNYSGTIFINRGPSLPTGKRKVYIDVNVLNLQTSVAFNIQIELLRNNSDGKLSEKKILNSTSRLPSTYLPTILGLSNGSTNTVLPTLPVQTTCIFGQEAVGIQPAYTLQKRATSYELSGMFYDSGTSTHKLHTMRFTVSDTTGTVSGLTQTFSSLPVD